MRLANDTSVATYDSSIQFQHWFYQDGTIEIHFGDINLENSTAFVDGEGFYFSGGPDVPLGPGRIELVIES